MFGIVPILALIFVVSYFAVPRTAYIDFGPLHSNLPARRRSVSPSAWPWC